MRYLDECSSVVLFTSKLIISLDKSMKMVLKIIGIIVALVGIIGFFNNPIIGILETSTIQNIVYIILGLLILMSVMKGQAMLTKIVGIVFAVLGILGFVLSGDTVLGLVQSTTNVNSFNLIVGIIILIIVFMNKGASSSASSMGRGMNNQQMPPQNPQM